jgi:hypothetical protein
MYGVAIRIRSNPGFEPELCESDRETDAKERIPDFAVFEMYSRFDSANISKDSTCKFLRLERKKTNRAVKEAAVISVLADVEDRGWGVANSNKKENIYQPSLLLG